MADQNQNQGQDSQGVDTPSTPKPEDSAAKTIPDTVFGTDEGQKNTPSTADPAPASKPQQDTPTPPMEAPPVDPNAAQFASTQASPPNPAESSGSEQKKPDQTSGEKKKFKFKSGGLGSKPAKKPAAPAKKSKTTAAASGKKQPQNPGSNIPRGALNAVVTRNEYYRDGYRNIMKVAIIEGIIIAILGAMFIAYMNIHQGKDRYFATTADGRILQLVPLDQPNMSTSALMSWVSQAATEVMTFGFHDYQRRLQDASRHFTRRGWESFTTALQRSRIIESVDELQQVVTAAPRSAPVLVQQGVFNGRYRWVVRLPLTVTFRSGSKQSSSNLEITITIERVPTLESPNGVGIESWIAR